MITYLRRLVEERNSLTGLIQTTMDRAAGEDRDLTDTERTTITAQQERCAALDGQITEHTAQAESARAWATLQERLEGLSSTTAAPADSIRTGARPQGDPSDSWGWGDAFVGSEAFRAYDGHGSSRPVEVAGALETRATITTAYLATPPHAYTPAEWSMTTPLLDSVGKQRVSTGAVEWITFAPSFPLAAVVAEGQPKPEATFAPTPHTASLVTYAHWSGITRQALEDLPRIRSIIETRLRGGLLAKIEADTTAALVAATVEEVENADLLAGVRIAIAEVQGAGYARPTTVLLNPADWAALDLAIMASANTLPVSQNSFFGIRPISAPAVPPGTAYVGDLGMAVTLFDRGVTALYVTDSHADYFIRNTLIILAETRCLPAVTEPAAVVRVLVDATP